MLEEPSLVEQAIFQGAYSLLNNELFASFLPFSGVENSCVVELFESPQLIPQMVSAFVEEQIKENKYPQPGAAFRRALANDVDQHFMDFESVRKTLGSVLKIQEDGGVPSCFKLYDVTVPEIKPLEQ